MNIKNYLMNKRVLRGLIIYIALAVLSGTLLALQLFWGAFVLLFLLLSLLCRKVHPLITSLCLFFLVLSFFNTILQQRNTTTTLSPQSKHQLFQIIVDDVPKLDGNTFSGEGKIRNEKVVFKYLIPSEEKQHQLQQVKPGLMCEVQGELVSPKVNKNPNMFNYKQYLYEHNIHWVVEIQSFNECSYIKSFKFSLLQWRFNGLQYIKREFPAETVGVTQALLFGETGMISEEMLSSFRKLGVVHILAISGLHVGLIFTVIYFLLLRIGVIKGYVLWFLIPLLIFYMMITGAAPPVIRASSMLIIILLNNKWSMNLSTLDSLSIVFILLIFYDPFSITNIGFQLSFMVCFSLVLSSVRLLKNPSSFFLPLVKVTIISQLSSFPLLIYHFYSFSLIGFLTNLFYVPLFSIIILPYAFLLFFFTLLQLPFSNGLMDLYRLILHGVDWISALFSAIPYNSIVMGRPDSILAGVYLILIIIFFMRLEQQKPFFIGSLLGLLIVSHLIWNNYNPFGEVIFIDVGQGDSIFIKLPFNKGTYLIDTGGKVSFNKEIWEKKQHPFTVGEDVLVPFLKSKGVTSIDKLILTHSDLDHIGGAEAVLTEMKVKEILISPNSGKKHEMNQVLEVAKSEGIPVSEVKYPFSWQEESEKFYILSPQDEEYEGNNDSLVLYAKIGDLTWLFTGDLEVQGENLLIDSFDIDVDVLKVGHHGSHTSTSERFLKEITPSIGIISAGESNRFGHPHPEVIERLKQHKVKIYNTGKNGAITYRFWDKKGTFSTRLP